VVDRGDRGLNVEWQVGLDVRVEPGSVSLQAVPDLADQPTIVSGLSVVKTEADLLPQVRLVVW
jgi:hypothetical protein